MVCSLDPSLLGVTKRKTKYERQQECLGTSPKMADVNQDTSVADTWP